MLQIQKQIFIRIYYIYIYCRGVRPAAAAYEVPAHLGRDGRGVSLFAKVLQHVFLLICFCFVGDVGFITFLPFDHAK